MSDSFKITDRAKLAYIEHQMGFQVLLNESVIIKRKKDSVALIGIENWGSATL